MSLARLPSALAVLLALAVLPAAQPLTFRTLTVTDGLPSSVVQAVGADGEGFVWLGTQLGAARYDGRAVRLFGKAVGLPDGVVWSFGRGTDDALVVGTDHGAARVDGQRFARLDDVPDVRVRALTSGPGALWASTSGSGVVRLAGGATRTIRAPVLAGDTVRAVLPLADGAALVVTSAGLTRLAADGSARHARDVVDGTALARADGAVWLGRADGTVQRLDPETLERTGAALDAGGEVSRLVASEVRPGVVWIGTRGAGIWSLDARAPPALATLRPAHDAARAAADVVDLHEAGGVLWAATVTGLSYADATPARFAAVGASSGGLRVPGVMSLHASRRDPDVVWVGSMRAGLHRYRLSTGRAERWFADPKDPLSIPFAILETADAVWLGGLQPSLVRFEPETGARSEIVLGPAAGGTVTEIVPRGDAQAWVATQAAGLHLVDLARRQTVGLGALALPDAETVWTVREARPGVLYVATEALGLVRARWRGDAFASAQIDTVRADGCPLGRDTVALATADGVVWAGGFEPWLARLDTATGACRVWTDADGLPTGGVGALALDADGMVWVNANGGLARFDPAAEVFTTFSQADGMPPGALVHHAFDVAPDGRIAVGGLGGFTVFDPAAVPVDTAPPAVHFTNLTVDGEAVEIPADGALALPHDRNDLAVTFAALDFRQPGKNRYRVQLGGVEDEWRPSEPEVRYPQLAPGRYVIRVSAAGRDGYWSAPAELAVRIRPPVWQTAWFWALVALAVGGVGYAGHRYRIEQILRVERTRKRIADDLHDDIGSKISSVALRLAAAQRAPGLPEAERDRLGRLGATARAVVGDLRDTVWDGRRRARHARRGRGPAGDVRAADARHVGRAQRRRARHRARHDGAARPLPPGHRGAAQRPPPRRRRPRRRPPRRRARRVRGRGAGTTAAASTRRPPPAAAPPPWRAAPPRSAARSPSRAPSAPGTTVAFRLPYAARRRWTG